MTQEERKRPHRRQGGRRPRVVGEQVQVTTADPSGGYRHADPGPGRQLRLGKIDERRRKCRIDHVELDGAHPASVRGFPRWARWDSSGTGRVPSLGCGAVRISDASLDEVRDSGFCLIEGFLSPDELDAAQRALWLHFPKPGEFFADPSRYPEYNGDQFGGVREFPYRSWDLNHLAFHPDLVDAVERYLGTTDLHLYKVELWAKYGGAADYDQPLHRDYGSHSLVVPRVDGRYQQLTTFIFLSDVTV